MTNPMKKVQRKIQHKLSHFPMLYALIVGFSVVLFWRGVWHTADYLHVRYQAVSGSLDATSVPWWDGPLSLLVGIVVLNFTGAFVSSFIGNELILSGLRGERRLTEKAEADLQSEVVAIADIKDELEVISKKLEILQNNAHKNHTHL